MTSNTHARFFALLKEMPYITKEELVYRYSNRETTSLSTLFNTKRIAYNNMISYMHNIVMSSQIHEVKAKRSAILHRLQKHGIDTTDWSKVNRFLEQPQIAGKRLYDMTIEEMTSLIRKLESILTKDNKIRTENERKAWLN